MVKQGEEGWDSGDEDVSLRGKNVRREWLEGTTNCTTNIFEQPLHNSCSSGSPSASTDSDVTPDTRQKVFRPSGVNTLKLEIPRRQLPPPPASLLLPHSSFIDNEFRRAIPSSPTDSLSYSISPSSCSPASSSSLSARQHQSPYSTHSFNALADCE
eukprot:GHVS01006191.1.p1 GENE.GHVS01006191.1~~GHVS01006191.1.p1  ORF type:complete len:156 (+),score=27.47 GHVS01006191.1:158-625(+)